MSDRTADRYVDHPWYEILRELIEVIYIVEGEEIPLKEVESNLKYIENYLIDNLNENCPDYADIGIAAVNSYFKAIDKVQLLNLINEADKDDTET
jgi:hypothetical protein